MQRRALLLCAASVVAALGYVGYALLAPEPSKVVDDGLPAGAEAPPVSSAGRSRTARRGTTPPASCGSCAGTRVSSCGSRATPRPRARTSTSSSRPRPRPARRRTWGRGLRLPVPGGAEDGQAMLRGAFNVPLPEGADPSGIPGDRRMVPDVHRAPRLRGALAGGSTPVEHPDSGTNPCRGAWTKTVPVTTRVACFRGNFYSRL